MKIRIMYVTNNDWYREPALKCNKISTNNESAYYLQIVKKKKRQRKQIRRMLIVDK
jgi:hypothetical protein